MTTTDYDRYKMTSNYNMGIYMPFFAGGGYYWSRRWLFWPMTNFDSGKSTSDDQNRRRLRGLGTRVFTKLGC
jgi:hypothetical protein